METQAKLPSSEYMQVYRASRDLDNAGQLTERELRLVDDVLRKIHNKKPLSLKDEKVRTMVLDLHKAFFFN